MKKVFQSLAALKDFVGQPAVRGEPIVVDQAMIDAFADITRDHQWIHVDTARATDSPYGGTIAHGLLTLSMITGWYHNCFEFPFRKLGLNYGFDRVRFPSAVPSGSKLVGSFRLDKVEDVQPGEVRCTWHIEVAVEGAPKPAMVADWLMHMRF